MNKDPFTPENGPSDDAEKAPESSNFPVTSGSDGPAERIKIEIHQLDFSSDQEQLERIHELIGASEAELIVFPEACTTGFDYDRLDEIARFNEEARTSIQNLAREKQRGVVLPLLIREGEHYYNRQYCIGPGGEILAVYDKIHLIGVLKEDRYLKAGTSPAVLDYPTRGGGTVRIGLATCYDLRFPELFRHMVLKQAAEVLVLPAQWPRERAEHFRTLIRARALENQCHLVACNGVNSFVGLELGGRSAFIDAKGETLDEASDDRRESMALELDLVASRRWRRAFPVLKDAIL